MTSASTTVAPWPGSTPGALSDAGRWLVAAMAAADAVSRAAADAAASTPSGVDGDHPGLLLELFLAEGRSLVRLARLFVDDRDAAEDIVQEAFLRLARHAGSIDDAGRAPAYLRSIVLNLARDHNRRGLVSLRHQARTRGELGVADDPATELADRMASDERSLLVLACLRELPRRQRDCVTLRYLESCPVEEIATTLGLSINSVKTHLKRGLRTLRRDLADGVGTTPRSDAG